MPRDLIRSLAAISLVAAVASVRADDQAELQALIAKAIDAAGGKAKLAKFQAATWKASGKYYGQGAGLPYTGEWAVEGPDKHRIVIEFSVNNMNFKHVRVLNGGKGWVQMMDKTSEMDKATLAEEREQTYASWVTHLAPLGTKAFQLSALGETKVGERIAVGVKVAHKDHRDVNLFFDKVNGRLLKMETQLKDIQGGREIAQEVLYTDYKETGGVSHPGKITVNYDGKLYVEAELTDYQMLEKADDGAFSRP